MKLFKHLKMILVHKWYVFKFCCIAGIPIQGLLHDLSKFSPTEFFESIKYFNGKRSPIENCKEVNTYSMSWYHHRGRNKHHWEFWVDNFEQGMTFPLIPYKYMVEMLCDWISTGKIYEKENWSFVSLYEWWKKKRNTIKMHPVNRHFADITLYSLKMHNGDQIFLKSDCTKFLYDHLVYLSKNNDLDEILSYCDGNSSCKEL